MSFTREETAKGKRAILSRSERKGLKSYTAVGVGLCGCGCGSMHLGLRSFFALALRPGGIRAPQIGGFCGSVAF